MANFAEAIANTSDSIFYNRLAWKDPNTFLIKIDSLINFTIIENNIKDCITDEKLDPESNVINIDKIKFKNEFFIYNRGRIFTYNYNEEDIKATDWQRVEIQGNIVYWINNILDSKISTITSDTISSIDLSSNKENIKAINKTPFKITKIGDFQDCINLDYFNFSDYIISISDNSFSNCSSLLNIVIPKNVTSIGKSAFNGCTKVMTIKIETKTPPVLGNNTVFQGINTDVNILVPLNSLSLYQSADIWKDFGNRLKGY